MKIPGHCTVTGEPCFDIRETWPSGHPMEGQPRSIGNPHDNALRVTLVTVSGATMVMTMTMDGVARLGSSPSLLPALWAEQKDRMRLERTSHRALNQSPFTPEQNAHADASNIAFNDDVPLGILCYERWIDNGS